MMRTLHRGLLMVMAFGLVAAGAVVAQHGLSGTETRGHDSETMEQHIDQIAEHLELSTDQRFKLEGTIESAHELMREFHQLHADLMAELSDEQAESLTHMMHTMLMDSFGANGCGANCAAHDGHGGGHGASHGKRGGHGSLHGHLHQNDDASIEQ